MVERDKTDPLHSAERDVIALGIAVAAIILFVGTGGSVISAAVGAFLGTGEEPDMLATNALLLNIALIIFGWRRYRELQREIAVRREAEDQARVLASTDPLTHCLNRRSLIGATEALQARAGLRGETLAFCMIDVDNFKQINDIHGHANGDAVLVEVCQRLRLELPRDAALARLGGDEFAFILALPPGQTQRLEELVVRIFKQMARPFELPEVTVEITISVGMASDPEPRDAHSEGLGTSDLMHRADMALYHAKKSGRNRHFWFEETMESELRLRHQIETGIRRGLTRGEFVPYYEQQIDVETGDLVGFEMLARWHSPQLGVVSPEIFIPVAEEIGVIAELSEQLMELAFADARDWDERLTLSVNISPVQLRDPWFAQRLLKKLVAANLPPPRLEIEITESCFHDNVALVRSMIESLRNQGIKISLDDFGTGYSSLEQLRSLPFDRLKIDRSFIAELRSQHDRTRIVEAIISLGRRLDLPITAEGVEDESILAALRTMGELKAQGFLYGRPESAAEVRRRLAAAGLLNTAARELVAATAAAAAASAAAEEGAETPRRISLG